MYTYISDLFIPFICYLELLYGFLIDFDNHWKWSYYHSIVDVADEVPASVPSTSTTTGEHGIFNCNSTSFSLII